MKRILQSKIAKNAADTAQWIGTLNIPLHASNTAYFIVLSVFPALLLVLSGLRFTGLKLESLLELFGDFLPNALMDTVEGIIASVYSNASGAVAGVSALTALWSASKGLYGLLLGLNNIYGVSEDRGYFFTRAISVFYTLLLGIVILLTLVLHVFGNSLISMLKSIPIPGIAFLLELLDLRFFLLVFLQTVLFTLMYMFLPNRRNRLVESLPGGLLASIGWLVFSNLYSIYVTNFSSYSNIYGSVYGIAISMLWLYCCMSILFFGGALNRLLMRKDRETRKTKSER